MTEAQKHKLEELKKVYTVLHSFQSLADLLVADIASGTRYERWMFGFRGGYRGHIVYKDYDYADKKPYHKLYSGTH